MNQFISYNKYKKDIVLNETYESYVELKELSKDIVSTYRNKEIYSDVVYLLSLFKKREYKVLKDFLNANVGIIYCSPHAKRLSPAGMFSRPDEYEDIVSIFNMSENDIKFLKKKYSDGIIIVKNQRMGTGTIIHELQHAYDNYRSRGKMLSTKYGSKFVNKMGMARRGKKFENSNLLKSYYRTSHEQSSYFVQAIDNINFFDQYNSLRNIKNVYEDFVEEFQGYRFLEPKDRKILTRKFSQYYYKLKERNIADET